METQQLAIASPYTFHYEQLQEDVLDAATACHECLDDAGIELEGELLKAHVEAGDFGAFESRFEVLQYRYAAGELKTFGRRSVGGKMQGYNIFFALALAENERAAYFFGAAVSGEILSADKAASGLTAAISAAKSYMFGVWLKSQADKSEE